MNIRKILKKMKHYDIAVLLFTLLIFSLGVGWLHSKSKTETSIPKPTATPEPPEEITFQKSSIPEKKLLSIEEILEHVQECEDAKGVSPIIEFFKEHCPEDKIVEATKKFIEQKADDLTREDKIKMILSLGQHYKQNKELQQKIFDIISANKNIEDGETPLLFVAVQIDEKETIPDVIEWYKKRNRPEAKDLAKKTLQYAAKNDYSLALKKLHEHGAKIDKKLATTLLWAVVKTNKGSKSIEFLKSLGADVNDYDNKKEITVLIQAIKNKNLKTVETLVKHGADVTKASEVKSIGYPLQIARELNLVEIEQFLRSKGAKD